MKMIRIRFLTTLALPMLLVGCIEKPLGPLPEKTVRITGKVLNLDTQAPIAGAIVDLERPPLTDTTDTSGNYEFSFQSDSSYTTRLITRRVGFAPDTAIVSIVPGKPLARNIALKVVVVTGLPDQEHFTMSVEKKNFPGLFSLEATNNIRVRVGDKFGNPVAAGTRINFRSRGGTITAFSLTDAAGAASATLYGGNPQPVDAVYGRGFSWVKATTTGEGGATIADSVLVLFSGSTIVAGPASGFTLRDGGTQRFEYLVADENGNPLSGGSSITVTVSGSPDVQVTGDVQLILPDTQDRQRYTRFSFSLTDTRPLDTEGSKSLAVLISVRSPNGDKTYTFGGTLLASDVVGGGGSGQAATIAFIQSTLPAISVREVGGNETAVLTFEVRDSLGVPVDEAHQVTVVFSIGSGPGGGEYISPVSALSDPSTGRVQTTLSAGIKAGVVQIVARATIGSRTIRSAPVVIDIFGGFPVQSHFSIGAEKQNFPGWDKLKEKNTIKVLAGDKWSNPVKPGTAVYFASTGGVITASGYTDATGNADAILLSGNPLPVDPVLGPGFARVSATTVGEFGETVTSSVFVLFSGTPTIKNVTPSTFAVPSGGVSGPINFEVSDQNGNPLAAGTQITVTLQYTPPPNTTINLSVTGDISVTLGDTQAKGRGTTQFTFQVVDQTLGGVQAPIPVTVVISVTSPNGNPPSVSISGTVG